MNNKSIFVRYKEKTNEINSLDRSFKDIVLTSITAFVLAFLIVCGPTTLLVNTYMFYDLIPLVVIGITGCAYLLIYLTRLFYVIGITRKECGNLKDVYLVDALIVFGIIIAIFMILFF